MTDDEIKKVNNWFKDLEKYIRQWAGNGSELFMYDCSKLPEHLFQEIANFFKIKNPYFYVETNSGTKMIKVTWVGKSEA